MPILLGICVYYATSPYKGAGDIDMAVAEQQVLLEPSCLATGIRYEPLRDRAAGGCTSFVRMTELERDSSFVA